MAIRYLDQASASPGRKIRYLDEPQGSSSLAETAVASISPTAPPKTGLGESLLRGTREIFAPSLEGIKRLINPNAGQFGPSRVLEQAGQQVGQAVRSSAQNIREKAPITNIIPATAGILGAAELMSDTLTPSATQQNLGAEGLGVAARLAGPALKRAAIDPARRAIGFQKSQLVSQKSPFETSRKIAQANRSAEAMLKEGALSPTGNVTDSIENASSLLRENSRKLSQVIDAVDETGKTINVSKLDSSLIDELKPKFDDEFAAADKIVDDLKAYSKNGLSLKDVDELKARWGKIGFQDKTVGSTASEMYRKAWGAADKIIKEHIQAVSPELVSGYKVAKAGQENAINALRGLGNKQAADLGNNVFSLPTKVLAAGQLATGNIPGALATAGVAEVLKRRGLAPLAVGTYGAGKALEKGAPTGFLSVIRSSAKKAKEKASEDKPSKLPKNVGPKLMELLSPGISKASASQAIPKGNPFTSLPADKKIYVKGLEAYLRNDLQGAKSLWQKALKANRKNFEARNGLERLAKQEGKDPDFYKPK